MEDLFCRQLQELYDAEQREVDALPKLSKPASSARVREALEEHLRQTRMHVERLRESFRQIAVAIAAANALIAR
jgi:ferritin-like metal-binding protein YciE